MFWWDTCLGIRPLCDRMQAQIGAKELELKVDGYWDETAG